MLNISPLSFAKECLEWKEDEGLTSQQIDAFVAIEKFKRISIRSGHGCGKDAALAIISLWYVHTRVNAKVVITSSTLGVSNDIFQPELYKWFKRSCIQSEFTYQNKGLFHNDKPKEWGIITDSPDNRHKYSSWFSNSNILLVCNEASGIPNSFFESNIDQANIVILSGNMLRKEGFFYDTHFNKRLSSEWHKLHWDSRKSSIVRKSFIESVENRFGINSDIFRTRVSGDPPK